MSFTSLRRLPSLFFALALLGVAAPSISRAQDADVRAALERFFTSEELESDWFASSFLDAVPFAQLQPIREQVTGNLGEFERLESDGERWLAHFHDAYVPTYASLDDQGRFTGLRLLPPVGRAQTLEEAAEELAAQHGSTALLVRRNGETLLARGADQPLAVGSAFKLVVLAALRNAIESGGHRWDETVELRQRWKSLPSGVLHTWPVGSPVTLHTLATLMMSRSDNTATDHLIGVLGRDAVEAADPSGRNRPFLTTGEAFRLKNPANADRLAVWREADEEGRRNVLEELADRPLPEAAIFDQGPVAVDVEWVFTAEELCDLIAGLADLNFMEINPGVVSANRWARVAYKGGSEPGVLNLTTWVEDESGRPICVCATRNAESEVELSSVSAVVTRIFDLLHEE